MKTKTVEYMATVTDINSGIKLTIESPEYMLEFDNGDPGIHVES